MTLKTRIAPPFSIDPVALTTTLQGVSGEYTDAESGLQYLRARYYDPATAQFITRDPIEDVTGDPYGYAGGNPIMNTDPTGLDWMSDFAAASAGIGDAMSFGLLKGVRNSLGGAVDECSDAYRMGGYGGTALGFVTGGEIRAAGLGLKGIAGAARSPFKPTLTMGFAGRHGDDQKLVIELAREAASRGPIPRRDAETLVEWAIEYRVPTRRGPRIDEGHPSRSPSSQVPHIHVGPVHHHPVI